MSLLNGTGGHIPTSTGHWVSEDFMILSEVIGDYNPNLELRWIEPENRTTVNERKKSCLIWDKVNKVPIKYISDRADPATVLAELFMGDSRHGDVLDRIDKLEAAQQAIELKRQMDIQEDIQDQVSWVVGTNKNYIHFNGKKFDDQFREIPDSGKKIIT